MPFCIAGILFKNLGQAISTESCQVSVLKGLKVLLGPSIPASWLWFLLLNWLVPWSFCNFSVQLFLYWPWRVSPTWFPPCLWYLSVCKLRTWPVPNLVSSHWLGTAQHACCWLWPELISPVYYFSSSLETHWWLYSQNSCDANITSWHLSCFDVPRLLVSLSGGVWTATVREAPYLSVV